jgi:hypothetical protein
LLLLFASDVVLPRLVTGFPVSGAWVGQILAGALLALGWLNQLHQRALLGGIYGRPVVLANATFYLIAAIELVKVALRERGGAAVVLAVVVATFACVYGWLLLRGPFERDFKASRESLGER